MTTHDDHMERGREAAAFVRARLTGGALDDAQCAAEPIRVPGVIQPHGALVGVHVDDGTIAVVSANVGSFLGREPSDLLGQRVGDVLPADLIRAIRAEHAAGALSPAVPLRIATHVPLARFSECWVHARDGMLMLEFEPAGGEAVESPAMRLLNRAMTALRDAESLDAMNALLVGAARAMTGYERVLIYRFDADWNGTTIAEDMLADWDQPFLGLRFPASDIPAQARALYADNMLRLVPSRDAVPVPLLRQPGADTGRPIDLSGARLRQQSPIHLEYQRNIDVDGAMSASILKRGRLWGLLVGHHRRPHAISGDAAVAVPMLVNAYAMRLNESDDDTARQERREQQRVYARLLERMAGDDGFIDALTGEDHLATMLRAGGAAIARRDEVHIVGTAPDAAVIRNLREALRVHANPAFATDNLGGEFPQFAGETAVASGVLALQLHDDQESMILWFRPEVASTVVWAGDPRKSMTTAPGHARILPRRSFERWIEVRRGYSEAWHDYHLDAATALGFAINEVIVRHARKMSVLSEQLDRVERLTAQQAVTEAALHVAMQEKDALLSQKDFLLREVDHRIRNSLALISSILTLQSRTIENADARQQFAEASRRVATVAQVHQRLFQTGQLQSVHLGQYLGALLTDLSHSLTQNASEHLSFEATETELPADDALSLGLIINELVTNAFKYRAPSPAPLMVRVSVDSEGGGLRLSVEDNGRGLPEGFDPRRGTGLGMRLVTGLIQRFNGELTFLRLENGTRFVITMPERR